MDPTTEVVEEVLEEVADLARTLLTMKILTWAACFYESWHLGKHIVTGRKAPTISCHVGRRPWIGLPIIVGLTIHFYPKQFTALMNFFVRLVGIRERLP